MRTVIGGIFFALSSLISAFFSLLPFQGHFCPLLQLISTPPSPPPPYVFLIILCPLRFGANYPSDLTLATDTFLLRSLQLLLDRKSSLVISQ